MTDAENDRQSLPQDVPTADDAASPVEKAGGADAAGHDVTVAEAAAEPAVAAPVAAAALAAESSADAVTAETVQAETVTAETVQVRRSPRYARFMLVGALACIVAAFILTYSLPQGAGYDRNTVFGFMLLVAIAVGITLGSIAALIADRVARRRAHTVVADRIDVRTTRADEPSEAHDA